MDQIINPLGIKQYLQEFTGYKLLCFPDVHRSCHCASSIPFPVVFDEQIKVKKIISPNNFDAYVEMEPEEELEPIATISVVKISKKSGFLMKDVSAKMNLNDENDSGISLKNGTEISVTGKSSDDKFYEVSTSAINQPLYVPLDSVALFGD